MSKMNVVDISQRSEEWLAWRAKGITASDIPVILGDSPYKTPWQLWAEKVGRINPPDISKNPHVKRGIRLEDKARQFSEKKKGEVLLPLCGEFGDWNILRASFDGVDSRPVPYEFKAPSEKVWQEIYDKGEESTAYKVYKSQVEAQCIVAGSQFGHLIFYLDDEHVLHFIIQIDDVRKQYILNEANAFWQKIVSNTPPTPNPERDYYIPDNGNDKFRWKGYASAWVNTNHRISSLKKTLKALEDEQKGVQKEMIASMGAYKQADLDGVKVSRFTKKGSIDFYSFVKDKFPDQDVDSMLEKYRRTSTEESRFTSSSDELVVQDVSDVVTSINPAYF